MAAGFQERLPHHLPGPQRKRDGHLSRVAADSLAAAVTIVVTIAALRHALSTPLLVLAAVGLGIAAAFFGPVYPPLIRDTVGDSALIQPANALDNIALNCANVAGPAMAGAIYAASGAFGAFGVNAVSFIVAAVASALIRAPRAPAQNEGIESGALLGGLRYLRKHRWLWWLIGLSPSLPD